MKKLSGISMMETTPTENSQQSKNTLNKRGEGNTEITLATKK